MRRHRQLDAGGAQHVRVAHLHECRAFGIAQKATLDLQPAQFVGAYHAILPLVEAEQEIVADLMATRHLITALISEWRAKRYPENRAYIMRHNPAAWEALSQLADLSRDEMRERLLAEVREAHIG